MVEQAGDWPWTSYRAMVGEAPVPQWLKVISIINSIALVIPVFAFLTNIWLPIRERFGRVYDDVGAKMVFAGTVWYFITCIQGPFQSLPIVQRITHFTQWIPAHAHLAVVGFVGMIGWGTCYFLLPEMTGRPIHSSRLANLHYWLMFMGVVSEALGGNKRLKEKAAEAYAQVAQYLARDIEIGIEEGTFRPVDPMTVAYGLIGIAEIVGDRYIVEEEFDVLFCDLGMREMSGWEVVSAVRRTDSRIGIVLLTGWGATLSKDLVSEYGIDAVLNKPFQMQKILATVHEVMQARKARTTA